VKQGSSVLFDQTLKAQSEISFIISKQKERKLKKETCVNCMIYCCSQWVCRQA